MSSGRAPEAKLRKYDVNCLRSLTYRGPALAWKYVS